MLHKMYIFLLTCLFCIMNNCSAVGHPDQYYSGYSTTTTARNHYSMICMDIKPQHSVDIDQIMGLWYGSEIIMHTQDFPGVYEYDSCVIIHLADVTEQMRLSQRRNYDYTNDRNFRRTQYTSPTSQHDEDVHARQFDEQPNTKYLRLVWSERDNNLEYTFNYTINEPGLWSNLGEQRGSLVALNQYTQFKGTVQVVKAVNDHLVLTFCGNDIKSSIYTVVLTRNRLGLSADELRSIRNLLSRRGLYTETIRKVCSGAASLLFNVSHIYDLAAILLLLLFRRS